jgi:transcriptional regulator with XRE-family HTH domain
MGRATRPKPERLPDKLLRVRQALGLSQNEIIVRLGLTGKVLRGAISGYELGTIEPPMPIVLRYARAAGVCTDVLIDDALDLPAQLPAKPKHTGKS